MFNLDFIPPETLTTIRDYWLTYWTVPVGLILLYFYGIYHFNTPDYNVSEAPGEDPTGQISGQLISLAPPRFTTDRRRFRRYRHLYVLLLVSAFILFVFCWSVVEDSLRAAKILDDAHLPGAGDMGRLQFRVVWALFALTGVLSSLPGLKQFDAWILKTLHQQALIPDSARLLALRLMSVNFEADAKAKAEARRRLTKRDTKRVADGSARGALETAVIRALEIKAALDDWLLDGQHQEFKVKLRRDVADLRSRASHFVEDLGRTLAAQAEIVPKDVQDIDEFIEAAARDNRDFEELARQRAELQVATEAFTTRLCLIAALYANATTDTPQQTGKFLQDLGFKIKVEPAPAWDLEAIAKVTLNIFLVTLVFNSVVFAAIDYFGLSPANPGHPAPGRAMHFLFSLTTTLLYALVILTAILVKRNSKVGESKNRLENMGAALVGYLAASLAFLALFALPWRHVPDLTFMRQVTFAFAQLHLLVAGYFVGLYIDRAVAGQPMKWIFVIRQAAYQALATVVSLYVLPDPPGAAGAQKWMFFALLISQSAIGGALLSYLVQKFYQKDEATGSGDAQIGDLRVFAERPAAQ